MDLKNIKLIKINHLGELINSGKDKLIFLNDKKQNLLAIGDFKEIIGAYLSIERPFHINYSINVKEINNHLFLESLDKTIKSFQRRPSTIDYKIDFPLNNSIEIYIGEKKE